MTSTLISLLQLVVSSVALKKTFPFNITLSLNCQCPMIVEPVCARVELSEYTYVNECVLECVIKKKKHGELLYRGACCSSLKCSLFDAPVCDHTGNMFPNSCAFEEAQCRELRQHQKHLSMDSTAPKCSCIRLCPLEWDPICDNRGNTHANLCTFLNSKCLHKQQFNEDIAVDYVGSCCDDMCKSHHSTYAICDSEGMTHIDFCSFYKAQCRRSRRDTKLSRLQVVSLGPCRESRENIKNSFDYFIHRFLNN